MVPAGVNCMKTSLSMDEEMEELVGKVEIMGGGSGSEDNEDAEDGDNGSGWGWNASLSKGEDG